MTIGAVLVAALTAALITLASAQSPVGDEEIRSTFVGKAACPPEPLPVGFGPFEFRADGTFFRKQDIASLYGRYAIAGGRICVTLSDPSPPNFCFDVLKDGPRYLFRYNSQPPTNTISPFPVEPCPLPDATR